MLRFFFLWCMRKYLVGVERGEEKMRGRKNWKMREQKRETVRGFVNNGVALHLNHTHSVVQKILGRKHVQLDLHTLFLFVCVTVENHDFRICK